MIHLPDLDLSLSTPLIRECVSLAISQIGVEESPRGSNRGPEVDEYLRSVWLDPELDSYPWCAAFVSWVIQNAAQDLSVALQFRWSASAMGLVSRNPQLVLASPVAGCVGVINHGHGKGHAFLIIATNDLGFVQTIEGNSNNDGSREGYAVVTNNRHISDITGGFVGIA